MRTWSTCSECERPQNINMFFWCVCVYVHVGPLATPSVLWLTPAISDRPVWLDLVLKMSCDWQLQSLRMLWAHTSKLPRRVRTCPRSQRPRAKHRLERLRAHVSGLGWTFGLFLCALRIAHPQGKLLYSEWSPPWHFQIYNWKYILTLCPTLYLTPICLFAIYSGIYSGSLRSFVLVHSTSDINKYK